jgi:hypothetical protein
LVIGHDGLVLEDLLDRMELVEDDLLRFEDEGGENNAVLEIAAGLVSSCIFVLELGLGLEMFEREDDD